MEITTLELVLLVISFGIMTFFAVWPSRKPKSVIDIEVEILDNTKNTIPYILVEELGFEEVKDANKDFWRKQIKPNVVIIAEELPPYCYVLFLRIDNKIICKATAHYNESIIETYKILVKKVPYSG